MNKNQDLIRLHTINIVIDKYKFLVIVITVFDF